LATNAATDELAIELGDRRLELVATPPCGETTDSLVAWLPDEGGCLCGIVFGALFGHMPNLVTMRGDRYRDALTVVESIDEVRALGAETLLTGHFGPIVGKGRIERELTRLRDAVTYIHDKTVEGMNAGKDVHTLMREVVLSALVVDGGYSAL
jgi:alkyl sulfatase BDS1-like metallo-beta-lactamase superfamily hydrolase